MVKIDIVTPRTKQHFPSASAYADVRLVAEQEGPLPERVEIRDETALAIASWWQSAGWDGNAFAALASGLPVDIKALLDDISSVRQSNTASDDLAALDCLATWALNHPSREVAEKIEPTQYPALHPMIMMRALFALQAGVLSLHWELHPDDDQSLLITCRITEEQSRFLQDGRRMFEPIED